MSHSIGVSELTEWCMISIFWMALFTALIHEGDIIASPAKCISWSIGILFTLCRQSVFRKTAIQANKIRLKETRQNWISAKCDLAWQDSMKRRAVKKSLDDTGFREA